MLQTQNPQVQEGGSVPECKTAQDGNTTFICLPRKPQHHLANYLYAICLFFLCSGPSKGSSYCCLYWYHAVCYTQTFRQTVLKPGCCVIHVGVSPTISSFLFITALISLQHTHSDTRSMIWQLSHWHLGT